MNGRISKLIRKLAASRGNRSPKYIRSLKRKWNSIPAKEREKQKLEWVQEINNENPNQ